MSATMGFDNIAQLTHEMENILDKLRKEEITVSTKILDVIFQAVSYLEEMVDTISIGEEETKDITNLLLLFEQIQQKEKSFNTPKLGKTNTRNIDFNQYEQAIIIQSTEEGFYTYKIVVHLDQECVMKAVRVFMVFELLERYGEIIKSIPTVDELEEGNFDIHFDVILLTKNNLDLIKEEVLKISEINQVEIHPLVVDLSDKTNEYRESSLSSNQTQKEMGLSTKKDSKIVNQTSKSIRVNIDRMERLMNLFEELVIDRGRLEDIAKRIDDSELDETVERLTRVSGDLQSMILNMRMVPIEQVFNRFPRMVRELGRDLNKEIELILKGSETELDRAVIDEIGDPLVHLLRNSIDHGIESPTQRKERGKPKCGTITLHAYYSGNSVFIDIKDNGAGINKEVVLKKAIDKGIILSDDAKTLWF
jgi:two-component system chemotaxis sensor kinase CheA